MWYITLHFKTGAMMYSCLEGMVSDIKQATKFDSLLGALKGIELLKKQWKNCEFNVHKLEVK